MNAKKIVMFVLVGLTICCNKISISAMPVLNLTGQSATGVPASGQQVFPVTQQGAYIMPGATAGTATGVTGVTALRPGVITPGVPGALGATPTLGGVGFTLPAQYSSESEIVLALKDAASPATPLISEQKSKIKLYEIIIKSVIALSQKSVAGIVAAIPQITYKTKKDAYWGFITDVVYQVLDSNLVTVQDLSNISTSLATIKADCVTVKTELQKSTSTEAPGLMKMFTDIADTVDRTKARLDQRIKSLSDFTTKIETVRKIENDKFDAKVSAYQQILLQVDRTIISGIRQDLITDLGRLLSMARDDAARQKVFKLFKIIQANIYFTQAEKDQLVSFESLKFGEPVVVAQKIAPVQAGPAAPVTAALVAVKAVAVKSAPIVAKVEAKVAAVNVKDLVSQLRSAGKDYLVLINVCTQAIDALPKVIVPADKKTLVNAVSEKLVELYNNRGSLKGDLLNKFISLFEKAKGVPDFSKTVTSQRVNTVKFIPLLNNASAEQDLSKKIAAYQQLANTMTKEIDSFERGRFIDGVTNLFSLRKKMTSAEVDALKGLLNFLNSAAFKSKNIFDNVAQKTIESWVKIIEATSVLATSSDNTKSIKDQVAMLKGVMGNLTQPNSEKEKKTFFTAVTSLFNARGDAKKEDLELMKGFFTEVQNKAGLLTSDQVRVMVLWIAELNYAASVTTGTKTYLESVLALAIAGRDINVYRKVLQLFTMQTPSETRVAFVTALNNIFNTRNSYDRAKLVSFFKSVDQRKLSPVAYLLGPSQKSVLAKWVKVLEGEIKAVAVPQGVK